MNQSTLLGVNIDHVATLRQARGTLYPSVVEAALIAERAGADGITVHLREDRRHIQDKDIKILNDVLTTKMNLEMAVTDEMIDIARKIKPVAVCLVPEKREELTTEGGLDVRTHFDRIKRACDLLGECDIEVSLFIDSDESQLDAACGTGAPVLELHTGRYADAQSIGATKAEYQQIIQGVKWAQDRDFIVNAGHGLNYHNVSSIAQIEGINELNIGHSIISRALFDGLENAVREMKRLITLG